MRYVVEISDLAQATVVAFDGDVDHHLLTRVVTAFDRARSGGALVLDLNSLDRPAHAAARLAAMTRPAAAASVVVVCAIATQPDATSTPNRGSPLPVYATLDDALTGVSSMNAGRATADRLQEAGHVMALAAVDSETPALVIDVLRRGISRVMRVDGEVDIATAPQLANALLLAATAGDARLVLDLTGVSFLDASALHAIAVGNECTRRANGQLDLACANAFQRKLFQVTGLDAVVAIHRDVETAVAAQQRSTTCPLPLTSHEAPRVS